MEGYIIRGGIPLAGEVMIDGAKNAALGILAGSLLTDDTVEIDNLPDVSDINLMLRAMELIGATVERLSSHSVKITSATVTSVNLENDYIKK